MEILSLQVVQNKAAGPGGGHGSIESLAHQDAERRDRAYQEQLSPGAHKSQVRANLLPHLKKNYNIYVHF